MYMDDHFMYDDPDKANRWMDGRMDLFDACANSVLSQEGDFEWIISLDERTPDRYVNHIIRDSRMKVVHCDVRDALQEEEIDTPWVITSRLDCDDQYLPGAVKYIHSQFEPKLKVIDFVYNELDWGRGKQYFSKRHYAGSMFISLIEPASRIVTAFCRPHGQVAGQYPMSGHWSTKWNNLTEIAKVRYSKPLALMVCHGGNITNEIHGEEITGLEEQTWGWDEGTSD